MEDDSMGITLMLAVHWTLYETNYKLGDLTLIICIYTVSYTGWSKNKLQLGQLYEQNKHCVCQQ